MHPLGEDDEPHVPMSLRAIAEALAIHQGQTSEMVNPDNLASMGH